MTDNSSVSNEVGVPAPKGRISMGTIEILCPECGGLCAPTHLICAHCGVRLPLLTAPPAQENVAEEVPTVAYSEIEQRLRDPRLRRYRSLLYGLPALLLALGVLAWVFWVRVDPRAKAAEGDALLEAGAYAAAEAAYGTALEAAPDFAAAHEGLGWSRYEQGAAQEAVSAFQEAAAVEESAGAYLGQGRAYFDDGEYERALFYFEQAVAAAHGDAASHYYLATAAFQLGDYANAWTAAAEAARLSPTDATAHSLAGWSAVMRGDCNAATEAFANALVLSPTLPSALQGQDACR